MLQSYKKISNHAAILDYFYIFAFISRIRTSPLISVKPPRLLFFDQ